SRPPDPMTRMRTPRAYRAGRECPPLRRVSSGKTGRCHVQDGHDALLRQAAELADSSLRARSIAAELKAQSEHLIYQLAQTQKARARALQRLRPAADPGRDARHRPGSDDGAARTRPQDKAPGAHLAAGPQPAMRGTDMLTEAEAVTLAALLEELAARHQR